MVTEEAQECKLGHGKKHRFYRKLCFLTNEVDQSNNMLHVLSTRTFLQNVSLISLYLVDTIASPNH